MSTLTAVYDLACSPPTYDAVGFFIAAEKERLDIGADELQIVVLPGLDQGFRKDDVPPRDPATRLLMRQRIVEPMGRLLPSCRMIGVAKGRNINIPAPVFPRGWQSKWLIPRYGANVMVAAAKEGFQPFVVPDPISAPDTITMTLREAPYWPTRNSNRERWLIAARVLASQGHDVVIVPDTDSKPIPEGPWRVDDLAATDLIHRANLYAGASLNMFVNNGPAWMAAFMKQSRSVIVRMEAQDAPCVTAHYFEACGLPVGSQLGVPNHYIAWSGESVSEILDASEKGLSL